MEQNSIIKKKKGFRKQNQFASIVCFNLKHPVKWTEYIQFD